MALEVFVSFFFKIFPSLRQLRGLAFAPLGVTSLAEREGFEPSKSLRPYRFSRAAPSTTRPSLHFLVGVAGLEPTTSATRTLRASQLRYTPTILPANRDLKRFRVFGKTRRIIIF
jgi:hypothetical protein